MADGRLILVTGGARSGKSIFAERYAAQLTAPRAPRDVPNAAGLGPAASEASHMGSRPNDAAGAAPSPPQSGAGRVTYIATAEVNDDEMRARVAAHRDARPSTWLTVEAPLDVPAAVRAHAAATDVFLVDCVTFWVSNLLFSAGDFGGTVPEGLGNFDKQFIPLEQERAAAARVDAAVDELLAAVRAAAAPLIAVTNEIGLGLVPEYPLSRLYRDLLGKANQRLAAAAGEAYLLVAGRPLDLTALSRSPLTGGSPLDPDPTKETP